MHAALQAPLQHLLESRPLTADEVERAFMAIMGGACEPAEVASLLTALACRTGGEAELVGAARAMRAHATAIPCRSRGLLDTCGTGGDGQSTFNISTAAAIVLAALGVPVAKHGNRGVTSRSGSADVLEALGVRLDITPAAVAGCVDEVGIGFCFAPALHGAMKHAGPVRKLLGFRTIFNLLGPLTNPAGAEHQVLGTSRPADAERMAAALRQLGTAHSFVVCGDGLDEVSLWGTTIAHEVTPAAVTTHRWTAADFGLEPCDLSELRVDDAEQSAAVIRSVFEGTPGAPRRMVVANAAVGLLATGRETDLRRAATLADEAIDSGRVRETLGRLVETTQRLAGAARS